jgi:hypothetical protein
MSKRGRARAKYLAMVIASDSRAPSMDSNLPRKSALRGPKIPRCKGCRASVCPENKAVESNQGRVFRERRRWARRRCMSTKGDVFQGNLQQFGGWASEQNPRGLVDGRRGDKCRVPGAGEILRLRDPRDRREGRSEMGRKSKRPLLKCASSLRKRLYRTIVDS